MNKGRFHVFRLLFALIVVFLVSFWFCRTSVFKDVYSVFFAGAQSFSSEISENYSEVTQTGETPIYVTDIEVDDREYDGTTIITISNIVVKDGENNVITDVSVTAQANTMDANAGTNKYVSVTDFQLNGENAENYVIAGYAYEPVLVDILPYGTSQDVTLTWVTKDVSGQEEVVIPANGYVYSGLDQRRGVSAYYRDIEGRQVFLYVNIVRNDPSALNSITDGFINAGSYIANAVLTQNESNYKIVDDTGDCRLELTMNRAAPRLNYNSSVTYTYTGALQSLRNYVSLNNSEQTLVFENDKFINLDDGKSKIVRVSALASQNYKAFPTDGSAYFTYQVPSTNFIKRTSEINVDNMITEYTYTGQLRTLTHNAYIDDSINLEQADALSYSSKESFLDAEENRPVLIFAVETGNFNYTSKLIYINIRKATINTNNWYWSPSVFNYDASAERSVYLNGIDSSLVSVTYEDNRAINAGTYTARATLTARDPNNYEEINFTNNKIVWKINKKQINLPSLEDRVTTYTGLEQQVSLQESVYYSMENEFETNAGEYKVYVKLNDTANCEWKDGSTDRVIINWKINKAKVAVPSYTKVVYYTGEKLVAQIPTSELYTVVSTPQSEVGEYQTYLLLNDSTNYEWETNGNQTWLALNWEIKNENYNSSSSILSLLILVIALTLSAVYVTLHFTMKARRRRNTKRAATQAVSNAGSSSEVSSSKNTVAAKEQPTSVNKEEPKKETKVEQKKDAKLQTKEEVKQQTKVEPKEKPIAETKIEVANEKQTTGTSKSKARKKRMLSMKKNDKKERRKKENKKLAQLRKPPAKRGRPPKKVETRGRKPKQK